ncbi:hypothetical protein [Variovorax sp. dw_308]|uniref:hypothetical protein n=1 Tax=Variovorax sp. dw_308 TaxID=2721546 RepID=UPI00210F10C3|nr:hypothetical protein [Variovorax sp. dw_308]
MKTLRSSAGSALIAVAGILACGVAYSQATQATQATQAANCDARQDTAACLREAGAARQEAARGGLTQPGATAANQNASARCQALPATERADCEARMQGTGSGTTTTSGSVMGGGVIRETVTTVPAPSR